MGTLILFLLLLSSSSCSLPFMTQASALFVFGDSTVDAGDNKIESCITEHFYPYGVDYNNQYTGRFTNGLTADFMGTLLTYLPLFSSFLEFCFCCEGYCVLVF
ncbi:hypothetical protein CsSME_00048548 [Camellia sinensis var. sinensis]